MKPFYIQKLEKGLENNNQIDFNAIANVQWYIQFDRPRQLASQF